MTEVTQIVNRREFIAKFMRDCGVTYSQACRIYESMVSVFEDGVVSGSKIRVGRVGALIPVWRKPREVTMHFRVEKGGRVKKTRRTYTLDGRFVFKFNLYRRFVDTHNLRWFLDFGGTSS